MTTAAVPKQHPAELRARPPAPSARWHEPGARTLHVEALAARQGLAQPAPAAEPARPLVVLKFGSSVLRGPADAPEAVTEIYRWVREGRRVLAVVSAFQGVTDRLLADARAIGCTHDNPHLPRYVALGEESSAALLAIACDRAGLSATSLSCMELGLRAEGPLEEAEPTGLDPANIEAAFAAHDVVIVPGFTARNGEGRTVLLGRGGSDLSAAYLAAELGAERVRLVKDVDGVYEHDPKGEAEALRFGHISWDATRHIAGRLIQGRALDFAERRSLEIEVGASGRGEVTVIGSVAGPPVRRAASRPLRVAVAGCGVVGGGVIERLQARSDAFEVVGVLVRDPAKPRPAGIEHLLTTEAGDLLSAEPDILVEALSCARTSDELMRTALGQGLDVVSANKQAVVAGHADLRALAEASGARWLYSAAVGGGAPLIELVRRARSHGGIAVVEGVLNGTVNFMLDRLAAGDSFPAALASAQANGLAEADPSADLDGRDAAAKLRILALEAFGEAVGEAEVRREALDEHVARVAALGRLKQVSRAAYEGGRLTASVNFSADPVFSGVDVDRNLLRLTMADGAVWTARGRGAGRWPTSESVLSDLLDIAAERAGRAA
ncbi:MAG TPA: homoserine dehydrogenase [Caulobacteraceae bacterium]